MKKSKPEKQSRALEDRNYNKIRLGPIQDAFRTLDWIEIREKLRDLESVLGIDPA